MSDDTLLTVEGLVVRFAVKRGRGFGKNAYLHAVDNVNFTVKRGETLVNPALEKQPPRLLLRAL